MSATHIDNGLLNNIGRSLLYSLEQQIQYKKLQSHQVSVIRMSDAIATSLFVSIDVRVTKRGLASLLVAFYL